MIHFRWYQEGDLFGIVYQFERIGDRLPEHSHEPDTEHNIVVLRGRVSLHLQDASTELPQGVIVDFDGHTPHYLEALEEDSQVVHFFLRGMPARYRGAPDSERMGTLP